jgi:hypothetical protein
MRRRLFVASVLSDKLRDLCNSLPFVLSVVEGDVCKALIDQVP